VPKLDLAEDTDEERGFVVVVAFSVAELRVDIPGCVEEDMLVFASRSDGAMDFGSLSRRANEDGRRLEDE
jgi:hypothetical protein